MKSLRNLALFVIAACAALVAGCNSTGPQPVPQDLQAKVTQACAVVQPTLVTMQAMQVGDPAQSAVLAEVVKVNGAICAGAGNIDLATIQTAVATTIPEAVKVIALVPMDPVKKAEVQIGLAAFQVALSAIAAQHPAR